jgi:hypothetical protein
MLNVYGTYGTRARVGLDGGAQGTSSPARPGPGWWLTRVGLRCAGGGADVMFAGGDDDDDDAGPESKNRDNKPSGMLACGVCGHNVVGMMR